MAAGGRSSSSAAYVSLAEKLKRRVMDGDWQVGSMIPARHDLAAQYHVADKTVQRAVQHLVSEGVLRTIERRGTFVVGSPSREISESAGRGGELRVARIGMVAAPDENMYRGREGGAWVLTVLEAIEKTFIDAAAGITRLYGVGDRSDLHSTPGEAAAAAVADGVDALVVVSMRERPDWIRQIREAVPRSGVPMALALGMDVRMVRPHVVFDQWANGYLAASHLLDAGYRRMVFIVPHSAAWLTARVEGARSAAAERGLPGSEFIISATRSKAKLSRFRVDTKHDRDEAVAVLLERAVHEVVDVPSDHRGALLFPSDEEALHAMKVLAALGIVPGRDVGVVGFDDRPQARLAGLTSLRPPLEEIGRTVAGMVLDLVSGRRPPIETRLASTLVPRATTVAAP